MKIALCALIVGIFIAYMIYIARKAAEPEFAVRGVLTGEKLGYMLASLAFGAKRINRGNGVSMRLIRSRLFTARKAIGARLARGKRLEACERTFYDGFYYIDETIASLKSAGKKFRKLPHVHGMPRIYSMCELLVKSSGGLISRDSVEYAVNSYTAETPLTFAEISALCEMLKVALCEYLAIYSNKLTRMGELIERGEADAKSEFTNPLLMRYNSYAYGLCKASETMGKPNVTDDDMRKKIEDFAMGAAGYNARVSAAIESLHAVNAFMTDEFVNSLSPVYASLYEGDASFKMLSESTKRLYLNEISVKAKKRKVSEKSVAQEVLFASAREGKDISHFILPAPRGKSIQIQTIAAVLILWIAAFVLCALFLPNFGWLCALLGLPVLLFAVDFIVRRAAKCAVKRRYLPSYDLKYLSAADNRTAILMPCFAANADDIKNAFTHLETIAAANSEDIFSYCILFDYPRSARENGESDEELNALIGEAYEKLGKQRGRTCVLVRRRKRVAGEEYYQGYEKKRGAVLDFNRYVLTGEGDFILRLGERIRAKYAVTLDSDTLTCDCAELVCIKAHPYCRDVAIVSVGCKAAVKQTPYAKLYAGETGPGRYRNGADNLYFDLFGAGNFTGKGIYDVEKFSSRLDGFFPDNRILSHDYAEGAAAGCYDSSANACEDFPQSFADGFTRELRWLRGDWQLLPYTLFRVKTKDGKRIKNPIAPISAAAIALNLILSLVPISQMLILLLSLFISPHYSVIIFAALPQILRAVYSLKSLFGHARQTLAEFIRCAFELAVLPTVALYKFCAVTVTIYRLIVRRKLLEWSVFAHTKGKISMLPNIIAAIIFTASAAVFDLNPFFYGLSVLFLAGVALPIILSMQREEKERSIALLSTLTSAAKKTFAYFEAQESLYRIPCDCYQEDNGKGWCARTSPTNIGMALVAYCSAYEIGIIDRARLMEYCEKIISAVEQCEKYKGNLYNWYDCNTLEVLPKRFVSTVDSGNFLTALSLASTYAEGELRNRIDTIIEQTDLSALFDYKRKLFYIGYDEELKSCTRNHYDLLGSESSLTYLFACGYGKAPKEAYYNLDRNNVRYGKAITVFSWTGGMFEYLMSRLFVAPYAGTFAEQEMKGAVRAHKLYAMRNKSDLWGISECRYGGVDNCGGNLYRAFGVPEIAYSNVPKNPPYAPYAAFLALPYCSDGEFLRNINNFAALGSEGDYGYFESICGDVPVKSYMTHHQGMILAACANALKSDIIAQRMQILPQWRAAQLLCGEERAARARRKKRYDSSGEKDMIQNSGVYLCKCALLSAISNGNETTVNYAGKCALKGISVFAQTDKKVNLTSGNFYAAENGVWKTSGDGYMAEVNIMVLPSPLSVALTVKYRNVSDKTENVRFDTVAEPILSRIEDYESHPAYSRMFIQTGCTDGKYVWARRKKEGVTVVHCVQSESAADYCVDKCEFYGRGRGSEFSQNINPVLSSAVSFKAEVGETVEFTSYFIVADSIEQADYAVKLAMSPDCVLRLRGAVASLAESFPAWIKSVAENLLLRRYGALKFDGINPDKPSIAREITAANCGSLNEYLGGLRLLYEIGFRFNTVLFCKKRRNEYPTRYFDAEKEVEKSGIRSAAVNSGSVSVINCESDSLYSRLKNHTSDTETLDRVTICGGKVVPYSSETDTYGDERKMLTNVSVENLPEITQPLGIGGFTDYCSYVMPLTDAETPAPWCNIMSNGNIGTVITEDGGGFTFGENSRQQKLTAWHNDAVLSRVSEIIALHDGEQCWSVPKMPLTVNAQYSAEHARGYSKFRCVYRGVSACLTEFISREENRKIYETEVENLCDKEITLGVVFAIKPVLGDFGFNTVYSLEYTPVEYGLNLRCAQSNNEAYMFCNRKITPVGADLENGKLILYDKPHRCEEFWGIAASVTVAAGEKEYVRFSLSAEKPDMFDNAQNALLRSCAFGDKLCKITFDGEFGYLTKWLPYQIYNSRFAARTGFYQVSGAYGFRDQLQDCLALLYCDARLVREHILECARHQFKEGDVQHWWHPPAIGVRTHVCDDRLWLVYTVCEYIAVTGDKAVLEESVPFLRDVPISPQAASVYTAAEFSTESASLFEHCLRAILISLDLGDNGLVRMRGGDWNDAMDKVGEKGYGTSVWCTMFLYHVIDKFMPYVKDVELAKDLREHGKKLYGAVCNAWCGDRFIRAYLDDGAPLGSPDSHACKIDLLTQSWSVISGIGSSEQKRAALETAYNLLCDKENKIIKLLDPPFTSSFGVGYIGDYPPYVRENGGQYTQAAVWYLDALFLSGQTEKANELLKWLSPAHRSKTAAQAYAYCVEPYVTAADVYGGENAGKGGWTWYTGSAAWLYKCLIEHYAGIKMRGDVISFNPQLPLSTRELNVTVLFGNEKINIEIINSDNKGEWRVRIGEVVYNTSSLKLTKGLVGKKIAVIRLI